MSHWKRLGLPELPASEGPEICHIFPSSQKSLFEIPSALPSCRNTVRMRGHQFSQGYVS